MELNTYNVLGDRFVVASECSELMDHIDWFLRELKVGPSEAPSAVRLAIYASPRNRVTMCCPEVSLATVKRMGVESWIQFRRLFMHLVTEGDRPHKVIHSACVASRNGSAALLIGDQNAGKTSLLTALLQRGYEFVTDDYAVVHATDYSVIALPTGVTAESKFFEFFPEFEADRDDRFRFYCQKRWQWTVSLGSRYPYAAPCAQIRPTHILFIEPAFSLDGAIRSCERDEALSRLIGSYLVSPCGGIERPAQPLRERASSVQFAARMLSNVQALAVQHGDLNQTADLIDSRLAGFASV